MPPPRRSRDGRGCGQGGLSPPDRHPGCAPSARRHVARCRRPRRCRPGARHRNARPTGETSGAICAQVSRQCPLILTLSPGSVLFVPGHLIQFLGPCPWVVYPFAASRVRTLSALLHAPSVRLTGHAGRLPGGARRGGSAGDVGAVSAGRRAPAARYGLRPVTGSCHHSQHRLRPRTGLGPSQRSASSPAIGVVVQPGATAYSSNTAETSSRNSDVPAKLASASSSASRNA